MTDEATENDADEVDFDIDMDAVPEMTGSRFPAELEEHLSDPAEKGEVPERDGPEEDEDD
jgi:hypothetical protein